MGTMFCDNCGVSLLEENAKFCRACGRPTPLSEAATKRFDEQPGFHNPTSPVGPSLTTPAYMAPFEMPAAPQTIDLKRKTKRNLIIVASMFAVMIFALAGLLVFWNIVRGTPPGTPPVLSAPTAPTPPVPPIPPIPPIPPVPPVIGGPSKIDESLIYPGSQQTMSMGEEGAKRVLQLQTDDPTRKVVAWYTARLKGSKKVSIIGQTILQAGDISVVIIGDEGGTQILITWGGEDLK